MRPADEPPADIRPGLDPPEPAPQMVGTPGVGGTGERVRLLALTALTAALLGLCVLLAVPLLPALTWGVALAILAWPLHRRIARHVARPGLAAAISSAVVVVVILVPGVLVTYQLAVEAVTVAGQIDRGKDEGEPRATVVAYGAQDTAIGIPSLGRIVEGIERMGGDAQAEISRLLRSLTQDAAALARGSVVAIIQGLLAVFILYHLLRDRAVFLDALRDLLPLSKGESDLLMSRAADSVHANLHAAIVTSVIIALSGGFMFWSLGLPAPLLWATVMFFLSILPVAGPSLVYAPAAVYLAVKGQWLGATALVGWGIITAVAVTNLLYVRLVGERMRMHDVPTLVAFLGGLVVFGLSGIVLGPAILAVTVALLEIWKRRLAGERSPRGITAPSSAAGAAASPGQILGQGGAPDCPPGIS